MSEFIAQGEKKKYVDTIILDMRVPYLARRELYLAGIDPIYVASLSVLAQPQLQLWSDINAMNGVEQLSDGSVPFKIWLRNIVEIEDRLDAARPLKELLDRIDRTTTGAPAIDLSKVPESKEAVIYRDDRLPIGYIHEAAIAAASIAKLMVPAFENGARKTVNGRPRFALGTGWIIAKNLLITNHHVICARAEGEALPSDADLRIQVAGTVAQFDYDGAEFAGQSVAVAELVAGDAALDFALLRCFCDRRPLRLARKKLAVRSVADAINVNIIQHPDGKPKQIALRNNVAMGSTDTELRYFTDTSSGSSGSPVLNDAWEVVALHRATAYVRNVTFQGRSEAYVNVGTHIASILDLLRARYPTEVPELTG